MRRTSEASQTSQRVKVGMIGLAVVILLIGIVSAVVGTMSRERPVATADAPKAELVANIALTNAAAEAGNEPLAELGVAPSAGNDQAPAP